MTAWFARFRSLTHTEKFMLVINTLNLLYSLANTVSALFLARYPLGDALFAVVSSALLFLAVHGSLSGKRRTYRLVFWMYLPQVLQIYTAYGFYYIQMPIFLTLTFGLTGITEPPFSLTVNVLAVLMCYFAYRQGRRLKAATA